MPPNEDLRKVSELWFTITPPPSNRRLYISVHYDQTDQKTYLHANLDDPDESQTLGESEIRFIATTLDEVRTRLGLPKGETKC